MWSKTKLRRCVIEGAISLVVTLTLGLLLIPHFGFFWHLLRGNTVEFGGLTVPVPKDYFVMKHSSTQLYMARLRLGAPFFKRPYESISVVPPARLREEEVALFESNRALFESRLKNFQIGPQRFLQVRSVSLAGQPGFCIDTGDPNGPQRALLCTFKNNYMGFSYTGDETHIPDFLSLLQGVTSSQRQSQQISVPLAN
jgi:hypothetical protein